MWTCALCGCQSIAPDLLICPHCHQARVEDTATGDAENSEQQMGAAVARAAEADIRDDEENVPVSNTATSTPKKEAGNGKGK